MKFLISSSSLLILSITFLCATLIQARQPRVSYGEICDKTTRCDSRAYLTCRTNGTCGCLSETEMMYDTERGKCVALSGERCLYTAVETLTDDEDQAQEKRYAEKLDCVKNATCSEDGFCGCNSSFFENSEGMCVQKFGVGENCSKDEQCDSKLYFVCNNGKCACNETDSIFNSKIGKCVGKVGARFDKYGRCVENAKEVAEQTSNYNYDQFCRCIDGFFNTSDGTCVPKSKYGGNCEKTVECDLNLICLDGKCTCNETDWIYDSGRNECLVKPGHSCHRRKRGLANLPCVRNAGCDYYSGCTCHTHRNYRHNTSMGDLCYGNHGAHDCHPTLSPCLSDFFCVDRKCICPYPKFQYFDGKLDTCISKLYGPCSETINGKVKNFTCSEVSMECVKNDGVYECRCKKGYIETETGETCTRAFGSECTANSNCDQIAGLVCWNGTCTCRDLEEYDEYSSFCRSLVGGKCGNVDGRPLKCTNGAECNTLRNKGLPGICRCTPEFEGNSDRKCSKKKFE